MNSAPPENPNGHYLWKTSRTLATPSRTQANRGGWSIEGAKPSGNIGSKVKKVSETSMKIGALLDINARKIFPMCPHPIQEQGAESSRHPESPHFDSVHEALGFSARESIAARGMAPKATDSKAKRSQKRQTMMDS